VDGGAAGAPAQQVTPASRRPDPARVQPGPGRFVFVPGSWADDVTGVWQVEAAGPPGCLRVVSFVKGESDEGLDVAHPIVVEGLLQVIRHPCTYLGSRRK